MEFIVHLVNPHPSAIRHLLCPLPLPSALYPIHLPHPPYLLLSLTSPPKSLTPSTTPLLSTTPIYLAEISATPPATTTTYNLLCLTPLFPITGLWMPTSQQILVRLSGTSVIIFQPRILPLVARPWKMRPLKV